MHRLFSATMTSKGQITIPKLLRERLELSEGETVNFYIDDEGKVIMSRAVNSLTQIGVRVFYCDNTGKYFECFTDKSRKEVDKVWLNQQISDSRKNDFKYMLVHENQINYWRKAIGDPLQVRLISDDSVKIFHTYGLLTDQDLVMYHRNRDNIVK
ncbi:AbrB/MazE/SpoVT family DNA-binding domain-containing protein [Alicyclobacillus fodiniaquatilis]|uniref:AbrB/MazE/SpoVT family DNA-binding domain-containing protein n=1 Tax=Alicyclobacillus fodiniaquatilis TaxID=1661150 RepID=A0ABW4JHH8_9BACL